MNPGAKTLFKAGGAAVLIIVAACVLFREAGSIQGSNPDTTRLWFYIPATKQLYAASADTIPPDQHNGDAVRAFVVSFDAAAKAPNSRKIVYLETFTPDLKDLLERIKAAHVARRIFDGTIPARGSSYFGSNTLVRRADEPDWHPVNTPEGRKIMAEWRTWRGPHGERPVACVP